LEDAQSKGFVEGKNREYIGIPNRAGWIEKWKKIVSTSHTIDLLHLEDSGKGKGNQTLVSN